MVRAITLFCCSLLVILPEVANAQADGSDERIELTAQQVFSLAETARARGQFEQAESLYRTLAQDRDIALRNEARFRLAQMLSDDLDRKRDAAVLLRQILDEQPDVARVRLELARIQAQLGNYSAAQRELRSAQAAGLPPEVERQVRFFTRTLASAKRHGFELELALAPDTNINRATQSDTLDTIIGEFQLDDDAQAQSGIGLSSRASAFVKFKADEQAEFFVRGQASGRFYQSGQFNDVIASLQAGPRYRLGKDRLETYFIANRRWFGGDHYSDSWGATGNWRHPVSETAQLRIDGALVYTDDQLNDFRDAERASLAASLDKALTASRGVGARIQGARSFAQDAGYSTTSGGFTAYGYEEIGSVTLVGQLGYQRIEADTRLFLFPERRVDDRMEAELSATLRSLRFGTFAPQVRVSYERSFSTVEIYDYSRFASEVGIVAAF